jgi:hypothetical protein
MDGNRSVADNTALRAYETMRMVIQLHALAPASLCRCNVVFACHGACQHVCSTSGFIGYAFLPAATAPNFNTGSRCLHGSSHVVPEPSFSVDTLGHPPDVLGCPSLEFKHVLDPRSYTGPF